MKTFKGSEKFRMVKLMCAKIFEKLKNEGDEEIYIISDLKYLSPIFYTEAKKINRRYSIRKAQSSSENSYIIKFEEYREKIITLENGFEETKFHFTNQTYSDAKLIVQSLEPKHFATYLAENDEASKDFQRYLNLLAVNASPRRRFSVNIDALYPLVLTICRITHFDVNR